VPPDRPEPFLERLLLQLEISLQISVGGFDALVAEPEGDGGNVHAGFEQVHGGGMADNVGRDALSGKAEAGRGRSSYGRLENVGHPVAGQMAGSGVGERR
jgi:hypothetical protein